MTGSPEYAAHEQSHAQFDRSTRRPRANRDACITFIRDHIRHDGDGCLIWPFSYVHGSGAVKVEGKQRSAQTYMCELAHGAKPRPGLVAGRECGRKGCVHPAHLRWMTWKEVRRITPPKGRKGVGTRYKLTNADVTRVRELGGTGENYSAIGAVLGVSYKTISDILQGKTWRKPRVPAVQRIRRPRLVLAPPVRVVYADARENTGRDYLEACHAAVPRWVIGREDIIGAMMLALYEGADTIETINWRNYRRAFYRDNFEQRGYATAFDDVAFAIADNSEASLAQRW